MGNEITGARLLHATLSEIERGLFHVAYRQQDAVPGKDHLPRYQVGSSESDARRRVEQRALECGYAAVIWGDTLSEAGVPQSTLDDGAQLSR